jgi:uncharacterized protein YecT (DUF1311 family)
MKKFLLMMILISCFSVEAQDMSAAETCIAENGGASSIDCLQNLYEKLNQELDQLNQKVVSSLDERQQQDLITGRHHDSSVSALKRSIFDFKLYRESSCNSFTYYTGAVASGYGQQLYQCLIKQTDIHNQFLKSILELK